MLLDKATHFCAVQLVSQIVRLNHKGIVRQTALLATYS